MGAEILGPIILWLIVLALVIVIAVYLLRWLYRRSTKEIVFVRTGFRGEKVMISGGAFVIPVLHEITPVGMNVMRIEVGRRESQALITRDRIRIDVNSEFFVKVGSSREAVRNAAQTLGRRTLEPDGLRDLLEGRFVSAMRIAAAQMTLEELHEQRQVYAEKVKQAASDGLALNGLELESVAVVDLDQTNLEFFDSSNAFDAEGLTQLTELIETRRRMRNEIEQRTQIEIRAQNLGAQRKALEIERESEYARLEQEHDVEVRRTAQRAELAKDRATRDREAEQAQILAREEVEKARLAQERVLAEVRIQNQEEVERREIVRRRLVDEAEIVSAEELERARIGTERGLAEARLARDESLRRLEIEKDKLIEIAELQCAIEVARKTSERSAAIAAAEDARAAAIAAEENAISVRERAIAERRKETDLIAAACDNEREAQRLTTKADAEKKAAADFGEAQRTAAQAEADAEKLRAAAAATRYEVEAKGAQKINEAENLLSEEAR